MKSTFLGAITKAADIFEKCLVALSQLTCGKSIEKYISSPKRTTAIRKSACPRLPEKLPGSKVQLAELMIVSTRLLPGFACENDSALNTPEFVTQILTYLSVWDIE